MKERAVSDELNSADAAATGTATPLRPTGKRSRRRALDTADATESAVTVVEDGEEATPFKTKPAKKKTDSGASRNPIAFVFNYLKQVVAELRKVIWPNRKQMVSYTSVVLVFLAFMVALIGVVDLGLAKLVLLVFG
jgi:preprotein translocase subunit SecE